MTFSSFTPGGRGLGRDLAAVLLLAIVSVGLGVYARSGCKSVSSVLRPGELAHPVFSLAQFRSYVETHRGLILDARPRTEYLEGHVPGARSLAVPDFDESYEQLKAELEPQKEALLVVYCSNMWCGLADDLQKKLIDRGFQHVGTFPDGWAKWQEAKLPVEKAQ